MAVLWIGSLPLNSLNSPNLQISWSHLRMPMMYIKSSIWSGFEVENWIEDQFQSSPKLVGIWTVLRCIFVPNLKIVTSICGELWHAQAQNGVNFDFGVQFDLEDQGQSPPKQQGSKVFYTYCPNLVILAWTGDELSCGQASAYRTHRRTDRGTDGHTNRQTQATTIPEGQKWPRVKMSVACQNNVIAWN